MKVTYSHEHPPYWKITADDGRWWSIAFRYEGDGHRAVYTITNARGSNLNLHGPTGQKLLDVVHAYERSLE